MSSAAPHKTPPKKTSCIKSKLALKEFDMSAGISNISSVSNSLSTGFVQKTQAPPSTPLQNFDIEDKAIISSEAKILNELDKYNKGDSDEINLALTTVTNKHQIEAELNVIKSKNEMLEKVLKIGEN